MRLQPLAFSQKIETFSSIRSMTAEPCQFCLGVWRAGGQSANPDQHQAKPPEGPGGSYRIIVIVIVTIIGTIVIIASNKSIASRK